MHSASHSVTYRDTLRSARYNRYIHARDRARAGSAYLTVYPCSTHAYAAISSSSGHTACSIFEFKINTTCSFAFPERKKMHVFPLFRHTPVELKRVRHEPKSKGLIQRWLFSAANKSNKPVKVADT